MAEKFEYTREWTDADAFPRLGFTKSWENPEDYPTIETDETQVRKDMQSLHDEVKDYINTKLIPAVLAEDATEEARAAAEAQRETNEAQRIENENTRIAAEQSRASAETARDTAEQERVAAETARADENTGIVARATEQANVASSAAASAGNSATEAAASESAAASSASSAAGSAAAASTSETNARASETAAKASENAAKASETAAKESETTAKSEADRAKSEADRAAGIVGGDYATKTDLSAHTDDTDIHVTAEEKTAWSGKAEKAKCVSITLSASGWDSTAKTQTVTVPGISATETDQMITPVPALASQAAYYDAGIKRTAQEADSLTFAADTVPTSDLTVYVVIMEVSYSAPAATLINFTINSTSFQAEEGMTWNEWIGSGYDTKNVLCVDADTGFVNSISNYGLYDDVLNQVKGTDAIAGGSQYYVSGTEIP